jgi:translation initiation factor 1
MAKEAAKIKVYIDRRRFGKRVTVIEGLDADSNPKQVAKALKTKLAAGGTYKDGKIILQGDHKMRILKILVGMGFPEEQIQIE